MVLIDPLGYALPVGINPRPEDINVNARRGARNAGERYGTPVLKEAKALLEALN